MRQTPPANRDHPEDRDGSSHPGIFVVGTGRCGSTLLRKLLRAHPDVHLPKETHWIPLLHDRFGARPVTAGEFLAAAGAVYMAKGKTALSRILKEEELDEAELRGVLEPLGPRPLAGWMTAFYRHLAGRRGASIWGDKTPDYGACMERLAALFPGARFLHIARDGRDVALSMSQVLSFRYQVAWGVDYWPHVAWERAYEARAAAAEGELPLAAFFELWRSRLARARDEATRLPAGAALELRYEDLLGDPRAALRRVHEHLRLPGDAGWVEEAAAQVRSDNLGRNRRDPRWIALTRDHAETLEALGFAP